MERKTGMKNWNEKFHSKWNEKWNEKFHSKWNEKWNEKLK